MSEARSILAMILMGLAWITVVHVVFFWGVPAVDRDRDGLPPPTNEFNRRQFGRMEC